MVVVGTKAWISLLSVSFCYMLLVLGLGFHKFHG